MIQAKALPAVAGDQPQASRTGPNKQGKGAEDQCLTVENADVRRVVHISIARAGQSQLPYFRGKAALETALRSSELSHAIVRPTVIWGGGRDVLLNNIAWCLRRFPVFLLPGGKYQIQPVHVEDLAALAVTKAQHSKGVDLCPDSAPTMVDRPSEQVQFHATGEDFLDCLASLSHEPDAVPDIVQLELDAIRAELP